MDKSQQQFITDLAEVLNITEEADMKKALEDIGSENIKKLFQGYSKLSDESQRKAYLKKQLTPEPTFAKLGAKLDYINYLKGKCPEGYEIEKFSAGGCMRCIKKSTGGPVYTEKPSTVLPDRFGPVTVENLKKAKPVLPQTPELTADDLERLPKTIGKDGVITFDKQTYWDYLDENNPKRGENIKKLREQNKLNFKY